MLCISCRINGKFIKKELAIHSFDMYDITSTSSTFIGSAFSAYISSRRTFIFIFIAFNRFNNIGNSYGPSLMGVIFMIEIHKSTDDRQNNEAIGKEIYTYVGGKRVLHEMNWAELKKNQYLTRVSHTPFREWERESE